MINRLLVIIWMSLIFWFSHQSATVSSGMSSGLLYQLLNILNNLFSDIPINLDILHTLIRKTAHFTIYFILGILVYRMLDAEEKRYRHHALISILVCALYAVSDEIHQLFINGRSGELGDVLIDTVGSAIGCFIYVGIRKFIK